MSWTSLGTKISTVFLWVTVTGPLIFPVMIVLRGKRDGITQIKLGQGLAKHQ